MAVLCDQWFKNNSNGSKEMDMDLNQFLAVAGAGLGCGLVVGLVRSAFLFMWRSLFGMSRAVLRQ